MLRFFPSNEPYPEVNIEVATLAYLEGDMKIVVLLKGLEEAAALARGDDHVEGGDGLEGHQKSDGKESELSQHDDVYYGYCKIRHCK